jgi:hypothetical protein
MQRTLVAIGLLVAGSMLGCGSRSAKLDEKPQVVGVLPLGTDLLYVQSTGVAQRLNVMASEPKPQTSRIAITAAPRTVVKRPGVDEILILSDGTQDSYGQVQQKPALTAMDAAGHTRVYELTQSGQQLQVSDDGNYAVLLSATADSTSGELLTNPNEIALVDLTQSPDNGTNPSIRSLGAVGGSVQGVWFTESMTIAGTPRQLALFSFPGGISLMDLSKLQSPEVREIKMELPGWVPAAGSKSAPVSDIVADKAASKIYLRNAVSSNVMVISFQPIDTSAQGDGGPGNDFQPSFNYLGVTGVPSAFAVYSEPESNVQRLVAAVGTNVVVVNSDTNTTTPVPLQYSATQIELFDGTSPTDNNTAKRALLYGIGQGGVSFIDLKNLEQNKTRAVQTVAFGATVGAVMQVPAMSNSRLLFFGSAGLGVIDLQTRHWSPIDSAIGIQSAIADPSTSLSRVWVATPRDKRVGYLDLAPTLHTDGITLDNPVEHFFRLDATGVQKVVVTHDQVGGAITIFDAQTPVRQTARKLEGFLLSGILN